MGATRHSLQTLRALNVDGFYDPLLSLMNHAVEERFVRAAHRDLIVVETEPAALLDRMAKATTRRTSTSGLTKHA